MGNAIRRKRRLHKSKSKKPVVARYEEATSPVFVVQSNPCTPEIELVPSEPEPENNSNKFYQVRALYSMKALFPSDLSFLKDDLFLVKSKNLNAWIEAINLRTHEKGFIPGNYVCLDDGGPKSLDAFYSIDRLDAEKKLFLPGQVAGTYIVRPRAGTSFYRVSRLFGELFCLSSGFK
ncbi:unnamed protein product [Echinostoma caproni]|uniref:SH3 domain-containing protein n=1 Tax=Echinostoma caproni TaxID=27848 RepID=A0A183B8W7_9TREM|nr:unnamed protein product [Echinostoma caproni]